MKDRRPDCPFCKTGRLMARDSRPSVLEDVIRKRVKECDTCGERVTTHEVIVNDEREGSMSADFRAALFIRDIEKAYRDHFDGTTIARVMAGMKGRK